MTARSLRPCLTHLFRDAVRRSASLVPAQTPPPGFAVSRVAAPPLVGWPMLGGFDDRGRLVLAEINDGLVYEGTPSSFRTGTLLLQSEGA